MCVCVFFCGPVSIPAEWMFSLLCEPESPSAPLRNCLMEMLNLFSFLFKEIHPSVRHNNPNRDFFQLKHCFQYFKTGILQEIDLICVSFPPLIPRGKTQHYTKLTLRNRVRRFWLSLAPAPQLPRSVNLLILRVEPLSFS